MRTLVLLSIVALAFANEQCGENSHFESCGTPCPLTCENRNSPPKFCVLSCKSGCYCDEGYVKTSDGRCVRPEQCSAQTEAKCGENAHFEECGTPCPLTCENYDNPPLACIRRCEIGCQCDEGFVRTKDGRCVEPKQCHARTEQVCDDETEEFKSCGTACPLTCDNYANPPKFCVLSCKIGCQCKPGLVRNSDGRCVKPEQCPSARAVCGENERFMECGSACPRTCDNLQEPEACIQMCVSGCQCEVGHVRNKEGQCVREEDCPKKPVCGVNEHFTPCGSACPRTCDNFQKPEACIEMCVPRCQCVEGHVKNQDGLCVREEECPQKASKETCNQEPQIGPCLARFKRWYHKDGECKEFIYGGCAGNGNNFKTKEECMQSCQVDAAAPNAGDCLEEGSVTGPCRAYIPRWSFNKVSGKCEKFIYGGCQGSRNSFAAEEDCRNLCVASAAPTACMQEKVVGPCRAAFERYFYNQETRKCEKFIYGGCQGNSNNFNNLEDCHALCAVDAAAPNVGDCLEEGKVTGPCRASIPRWSFNKESGKCEKFIYGGCHGSRNSFAAEEDCRNLCVASAAPTACLQEKMVGPCKAYFERYFYNQATGKCEKFVYGGCQGNSNNFNTLEDCHSLCAVDAAAPNVGDCLEEGKVTGTCRASIPRWSFNTESGKCEKFIYGGCHGSRNNFKAEEDCRNLCVASAAPSACNEPKAAGRCKAYLQRYFYNTATGKCEEFTYSGCGGNSNNFNTLEDCHGVCLD